MYKIYNEPLAGFGNEVIKYMACKILQNICGYEITNDKTTLCNPSMYSDFHWYNGILIPNSDLYLHGYFQNCVPYIKYKDYLVSLFTPDNNETIITFGQRIFKISEIIKDSKHTYDNEIVVHLRLSDNECVIHPKYYINILDQYKDHSVTIVVDKIVLDYEREYLKHFDKYNPTIKTTTILDDFNYLRNSKIAILSNSTFAYLAGFFGNHEKVYLLYNDNPNQLLNDIGNPNCTSIKVTDYYAHETPKFNYDHYVLRDSL